MGGAQRNPSMHVDRWVTRFVLHPSYKYIFRHAPLAWNRKLMTDVDDKNNPCPWHAANVGCNEQRELRRMFFVDRWVTALRA
jgi:hypothetical protein